MIDHSLALQMALWSDPVVSASPLFPEDQVRRHCTFPVLAGRGSAFAEVHNRWSQKIDAAELVTLRSFIPQSWQRKRGDIDKIFRFISNRPTRFSDIQTDLRRIVK
jgi:hypothetical protein